jgi:dipeptidyl aminopeptidase/acylaminoacyl peptidase
VRDLTPYKGIQAQHIALDPKFPNQALIGMNLKDSRKHDAYRIDLKSGKSQLDTEAPGNIDYLRADPKFQIRAAVTITPDGGSELLTREDTSQPWKTIRKWKPDEYGEVVDFSQDGKTLYILSDRDANTVRLNALNLATGKETVLAQDPQHDAGNQAFL